jgi:hypothetical protein
VTLREVCLWGSAVPPAAVYLYSPDRRGIDAEVVLGTCRDGYTGIDKLYLPAQPVGVSPLAKTV